MYTLQYAGTFYPIQEAAEAMYYSPYHDVWRADLTGQHPQQPLVKLALDTRVQIDLQPGKQTHTGRTRIPCSFFVLQPHWVVAS